jgi:hypothetical protein
MPVSREDFRMGFYKAGVGEFGVSTLKSLFLSVESIIQSLN